MSNVNDLGYGHCPICTVWKQLNSFHPKDREKPRKMRRKVCANCAQAHDAANVPYYKVCKAISNHRTAMKEGDYDLHDLLKLHYQQGGKCAYCSTHIPYEFSLDHIVPVKFGGRNLLVNINLVCSTCNSSKQHFELMYWLRKKKHKLLGRTLQRISLAYDFHEYEFSGSCTDCSFINKQTALCSTCIIRPKQAVNS